MKENKFSDYGNYDFMKLAPLMGAISAITFIVALFFIFTKGFDYGIDFAGGTEIQAKFAQAPDVEKIRTQLEAAGVQGLSVQSFGKAEDNEVLMRMQQPKAESDSDANKMNQQLIATVTEVLKKDLALPEDGIRRVDSVGPQVGSELKNQALLSVFYCLLVILIYVGLRFDFRYSPGAVICLFHDTVVVLGIFSVLGREINIQVLAGILTLIGYSINDTIVVYDNIRANEPIYREKGLNFVINRSMNEMLVRTILTGCTTISTCVFLYVLGSGVIQDIAFTLLVGVLLGTYSSIYVASPLIPITERFMKRFV